MLVIEGKSEEEIKSEQSAKSTSPLTVRQIKLGFHVRVPVTGLDKKVFKTL
jgi:hypothetical protein